MDGRIALALAVCFTVACNRPPGVPNTAPSTAQNLPFDRQPSSTGLSPAHPSNPAMHIPGGTSITVRLTHTLSSASARSGDSVEATLDDPIVVDQQTLLSQGVSVGVNVLEVKPSAGADNPGYLRITLVSVNINGKSFPIETSSIFAKASRHDQRSVPGGAQESAATDITFRPERRLTFHLTQAVDLE